MVSMVAFKLSDIVIGYTCSYFVLVEAKSFVVTS